MESIVLPIGNWKNLALKDGKWSAQIEYNSSDLGQLLKQLEDEGQTFSTSVGYLPISFSNEVNVMLPGQKYATTTTWELLEISICTVQSNRNAVQQKSFDPAVKQYKEVGSPSLSQKSLDLLDAVITKNLKTQNPMTELFAKLEKEVKGELSSLKSLFETFIKGNTEAKTKTDGEKPSGEEKPEEGAAEGAERMKEFTGKVEAIEKKLGEMQTENETISKAKDDAEAAVKTLTTEKETLVKEVADLKAANLKLSGKDGNETEVTIDGKDKNAIVPEKPVNETPAQKTKRLADLAAKIN